MSFGLQIVFIFASIWTFRFIIRQIQKKNLNIEDSIVWILWSLLLLIFSIFPQIPSFISNILGFKSMSNFIFSMFVFFLYLMLFSQSIKISDLKEKNKDLVQKLSIKEYEEYLKNKEDKK
ncbi:DUF2304 domain-containing protein [Sharpea azabuensis]|uniref:DUF2304 domain-containing protein n=1 Tax=Sharpea azabuensis TaxID=322505 RepID=UPI0015636A1A|nr:DUF2304 domain-containing protein [Sharpea azabuensis]